MPRVVIIAGEASGDQLGASLIRAMRKLRPDVEFEGVAGAAMRAEGCAAWFDCRELAVMGLFEVIRHLPRLLSIRRQIKRRLLADPPDVLVGIDAPDFNLNIEKLARRNGIPTVHYVCPSVWAWRSGRVRILRRSCDRVLCLLPFEAAFLEAHDVAGEFVGHPMADEIPPVVDKADARQSIGIEAETVVALLPGSREGEVSRLGPVFAGAAAWLAERLPDIQFVSAAASPELRVLFESQLREEAPGCRVTVLDGRSRDVIASADAVLVASGTATLETMLLKRPMVMAYKLSPLTYFVGWLTRIIKVDQYSLPNLLAGKPVIREMIQAEATSEAMGAEMLTLLQSPEHSAELAKIFAALHDQIRCSAGDRAARAVLETAGLNA
jgi:lipid-A-disaccharide synthase